MKGIKEKMSDEEKEDLIKQYILGLLSWQETRLKCINLGWTRDKETLVEIDLIKMSKEEVNKKWKNKR